MWRNSYILLILFFLIFLIYGQTLWGDFVFDDRSLVEFYEILKNPSDLDKIFMLPYWSTEAGLYRPVTLFTYSINYFVLGTSPAGFHFINLVLYGLTCFFIFKFLEKMFKNRNYAFVTAIIFLILPIHTEAVANIIGRAEILALMFSILVLNELIKEKINHWLIFLFLFLAIGSKETAIAILPIMLFVVYLKEKNIFGNIGEFFRKYSYSALAIFSAVGLYFSLRLLVLGQQHFLSIKTSLIENPLLFTDTIQRLATGFSIFTMYLGKSIIPINLCSDYSFNQIPIVGFGNFQPILGLGLFTIFIFSIFYFIKKAPLISLGSTIFIFSFLPISNLFFPIGTIAGERLMFFPSLGLVMILSYFVLKIYDYINTRSEKNNLLKIILLCIAGCIFIFYIIVGIIRTNDWISEKKLFTSGRACAPHSVLSLSNMGTVYYFEGKLKEAEQEFLASNAINDGYSKGLNNLGLVYWKMGDNKKAREFYLKSLDTAFPYPGAYENLALLSLSEGKIEEARKWLTIFFDGNQEVANSYIKNATR